MKRRIPLLLSLITVFAISVSFGATALKIAPERAFAAENEVGFSLGLLKLSNINSNITTRNVWAEEVTYTPDARTFNYGSDAGQVVQGPTLYGYRLKSNNAYSNTVLTSNTTNPQKYNDGTDLTVNGYSVPGTHAITTSINEKINTNHDVEFYMGTIVDAKQGSGTNSNRFYMVLSDSDGEVKSNGFDSSGNFLSLSFSRHATWEAYDARQQNYGAWVYVGKNGDTYGTDAGGNTDTTTTAGVNKALYGQPIQGWGNCSNYYWSDAYEGSERLVKVNYHFYEENSEAFVSVTLTSVYKDNINEVERYPDDTVSPSYTYTAKLSDFGLTLNSEMKLYFGYSNTQAAWYSNGGNFLYDDDEDGNGTPRSEALKRTLPMSLQLYNYTNGDLLAKQGAIKAVAGASINLENNVEVRAYENEPTSINFVSDNADFFVLGSTLSVAAGAKGSATITATANDGRTCKFIVYTDDNYLVKANWNGVSGSLGENGEDGSLEFYADVNAAKHLYGYRLKGEAFYYGFDTKITYDYPINISKPLSFILDPNYDANTGDAKTTYDETTGNRRMQINVSNTLGSSLSWNVYAKHHKSYGVIRVNGSGISGRQDYTNEYVCKAFYGTDNYYLKVEIIPDGNSGELIFTAIDKSTLQVVGEPLTIASFGIPTMAAESPKLTISYFTSMNDKEIASVPDREKITEVDFGIYNFANGKFASFTAENINEAEAGALYTPNIAYTVFDGITESVNLSLVSLNEDVAVIENGKIRVQNVPYGSAEIQVLDGENFVKSFRVVVPLNNIEIVNKQSLSALTLGDEALKIEVYPEIDGIEYSVDDESVATAGNGELLIVGRGKATLKVNFGNVEDSLELDVHTKEMSVDGEITVNYGETETLSVTSDIPFADFEVEISGEAAEVVDYGWSELANAFVITLRGVSLGEATIELTCKDNGELKETVIVEVVLGSVEFTLSSKKLDIGEEFTLSHRPDFITLEYSSSDESVATVDENGKVTAISSGVATISGRYGEVTATIEVTVLSLVEATANEISVEVGKTVDAPIRAASYAGLIFASANDKIFTVSDDGVITGVAAGTSQLVVVSGEQRIVIEVTVTKNAKESAIESVVGGGCGASVSVSFALLGTLMLAALVIIKKSTNR